MPSPDLSFELRTAQDGDYDFAERLYLATMKPLLTRLDALDEPELIANFKRLYQPCDVKIIVVEGVDIRYEGLEFSAGGS